MKNSFLIWIKEMNEFATVKVRSNQNIVLLVAWETVISLENCSV